MQSCVLSADPATTFYLCCSSASLGANQYCNHALRFISPAYQDELGFQSFQTNFVVNGLERALLQGDHQLCLV